MHSLRRAIDLAPNLVDAHRKLASALDILGREADAVAAYEAVVRLDPTDALAWGRIGNICFGSLQPSRAIVAYRAAAKALTADPALASLFQAQAALTAGNKEEVIRITQSVLADDPARADAHVLLGQVLAESGDTTEAASHYRTALDNDPTLVGVWYPFSTLHKFTAGDAPVIARMAACLDQPMLTHSQRMAIHFALGKAHDDLKNYATAMHHLDAANQLRAVYGRLNRGQLQRQTDQVIAGTPKGFLNRVPEAGVPDELPILIVGMPRSGTTLVEQILSSHPMVAAGGELEFWRQRDRAGLKVFEAADEALAAHTLAADYLKTLRDISADAARVTDKMPFNFAHLGVIRQLFPRATIVHCRRHPIDTCLSNYATNFAFRYDYAAERGSLVFFYREYQRLMAHWRDVLPPDRFIEVDYEELVENPEPITRQLIATCGLTWDDACLSPQSNRRIIATASLWQARQPIYRSSTERWRRYEPWLGELRTLGD